MALKKTGALKNCFPVQFEQMLSAHRIWIDTKGKEGKGRAGVGQNEFAGCNIAWSEFVGR